MKKRIGYILSEGSVNDIDVLNDKERDYFKIMRSQSGVLFLSSKPGIGKSALMRSIAKKLNYNYIDIRLSMIDETDIGLYPKIKEIDGEDYLYHVTPYWAKLANDRPTIIHFEELNRTTLHIRNAALQILLERQIGPFFTFNENVYFVSSGNLGDKDDTDVEEFDKALDGRLIHIFHDLTLEEWIDYFANDNIHKSIIEFLISNKKYYYQYPSDSSRYKSYASPRSWTFLSDFIVKNYGINSKPDEFVDFLMKYGYGFVGDSITPYIRFCRTNKITINDVLNDYENIKDELLTYNRDKKSEILINLKSIRFNKLLIKQIYNLKQFLLTLSDDEIISYFNHLLEKDFMYKSSRMSEKEKIMIDNKNEKIKKFFAQPEFTKYKNIMKEIFENQYKKII
jgi:hypothetical protein